MSNTHRFFSLWNRCSDERRSVDLESCRKKSMCVTNLFWFIYSVQKVGCFKDTSRRAIPQLDGSSPLLRGNYQRRRNAIAKCVAEAMKRGYRMIGIQHGGWCASGPRAQKTFAKYGRSNRCRNGKGGPWANDVYRISGILYLTKKFFKLNVMYALFKRNFTPISRVIPCLIQLAIVRVLLRISSHVCSRSFSVRSRQ